MECRQTPFENDIWEMASVDVCHGEVNVEVLNTTSKFHELVFDVKEQAPVKVAGFQPMRYSRSYDFRDVPTKEWAFTIAKKPFCPR